MIVKYLPIQGGVSIQNYWLAQTLAELGHEIVVLTNANEVEDEYRIQMNAEDMNKLSGFRKSGSIRVISTEFEESEFHIPYSKPFGSKLLSLGLEVVGEFRPDFIFAHYVEPYGVVAMNLSALTGIPYTIKHAGSDLGKLSLLPQLKTLHELVYRRAVMVATQSKHHPYFQSIGVEAGRLSVLGFKPWPADVFTPTDPPPYKGVCQLMIYGKTGRTKGTDQLLDALSEYGSECPKIKVTAYWGGKHFQKYREKIEGLGLIEKGLLELRPYVPHWRIAESIRQSHAVLYLENDFKISIHGPGIPFEILGSARPMVTTAEIASKYPTLINESNSEIIAGTPLRKAALLAALSRIAQADRVKQQTEADLDLGSLYFKGIRNVERFLSRVQASL
jgi:glycosyltransferase involved in cell wall biosynthesis